MRGRFKRSILSVKLASFLEGTRNAWDCTGLTGVPLKAYKSGMECR